MKVIFRWDISCLDDLPDYMKFLYRITLDLYEEIEQEMQKSGRTYAINYYKKAVWIFRLLLFILAKKTGTHVSLFLLFLFVLFLLC